MKFSRLRAFSGINLVFLLTFVHIDCQNLNITQIHNALRNFILRSDVNSRQRMLMPNYSPTYSLSPTKMPSRAINSEPFYDKWPKPRKIPFDLDVSYSQKERETIIAAMTQINGDTNGCVRFIPYDPQNQTDYISITPLEDAGSLRYGCWSFPGKVWNQNGKGQLMGITRGPSGCVTSQREVMKTLVHAVGFRMVLNRPDRDRYVQINYENMAPEWRVIDPYKKYADSQVIYRSLPFDFNSITMHSPYKFSRSPLLPVYVPLDVEDQVGNQTTLSFWDCVGISTIYGCNPNGCPDPYDDGIPSGRSTPNGPVTRPSVRPLFTTTATIETTPTVPDFPDPIDPDSTSQNPNPPGPQTQPTLRPGATTESTTEFEGPPLTFPPRTTPKPRPLPGFSTTESTTESEPPPLTFPPRPTQKPIPIPNFTPDPGAVTPATLNAVQTAVCRSTFRVDSAVYSENGKIYLFSGDRYWTMDYRGDIIDAGLDIVSIFDGRVQPPIRSAWSDGKKTILVDASLKEIVVQNEKFINMSPSLFPKINTLGDAFSYNTPSGPIVYFTTNNHSEVQIGPEGTSRKFSENVLAGLGDRIDAAFTIPLLGTQIVGMFSGNDFAYVTPCTTGIGRDPSPCFESVPIATWPVKFSNLVSFPSGNCRRRIRLKFPHFRTL